MVVAEVRIELKEGVSDPEGANTQKALELLGFSGIERVRSVKAFEITLSESVGDQKEAVEEMCRRLLANPVIHRYSIEFK
ncbi:MAG TPA: phosphoribosylformylglycinamidine synthase, purS protein [Euryarchaeota archaeon]|nr:phosphoribosylformylglycinamidine synthase, purS protein [Euryarchaeota archaeon]